MRPSPHLREAADRQQLHRDRRARRPARLRRVSITAQVLHVPMAASARAALERRPALAPRGEVVEAEDAYRDALEHLPRRWPAVLARAEEGRLEDVARVREQGVV